MIACPRAFVAAHDGMPPLESFTQAVREGNEVAVLYALQLHEMKGPTRAPRPGDHEHLQKRANSNLAFNAWRVLLERPFGRQETPVEVRGRKHAAILYDAWADCDREAEVLLALAVLVVTKPAWRNDSGAVLDGYARSAPDLTRPIVIPAFCVEKHTATGRAAGATTAEFARVGALVENEWVVPETAPYRAVYMDVRAAGAANRMSNALIHALYTRCARGQIKTADFKPYCFYHGDKVYKGPFPNAEHARRYYALYRAFRLLGTPVPACELRDDDDGHLWLVLESAATRPEAEWSFETRQGSLDPTPVRLAVRESMGCVQLQDLADEKLARALLEGGAILALFDAAFLNRGDMGPWNILVNYAGRVFLIDYENESGRTKIETGVDLCAKSCRRAHVDAALNAATERLRPQLRARLEHLRRLEPELRVIMPDIDFQRTGAMLEAFLQ